MKTKILLVFVVTMTITLSGCLVKSLHPFYKDRDIVYEPEINGIWMDSDSATWEFSRLKYSKGYLSPDTVANSFKVKYLEEGGDSSFLVATVFKLKDDLYVDFFPLDEGQESLTDLHLIPSHSLARIYIWSRQNITFFWYNEDWLNDLFEKNRVKISHEVVQTGVRPSEKTYVLTASTEELQKFIKKYAIEQDIFKNLDKKELINNPMKEYVFNFINTYLKKGETSPFSEENTPLVFNLKRINE